MEPGPARLTGRHVWSVLALVLIGVLALAPSAPAAYGDPGQGHPPRKTTGSIFASLTNVAGRLYFSTNDGTHGYELWRSDGTAAGTKLVKDINPGAGVRRPTGSRHVAGTLYFAANDGTHGYELWKSDGTAAGTTLVKDIDPGANSSSPVHLTEVAGTLFFTAGSPGHGRELWTPTAPRRARRWSRTSSPAARAMTRST